MVVKGKSMIISAAVNVSPAKKELGTSVARHHATAWRQQRHFYYHFQNKEQLLEALGHAIIAELVNKIGSSKRSDPTAQVARGPLVLMQHADDFPDQRRMLMRIIDDPDNRHQDLGDELTSHIEAGVQMGRFMAQDAHTAMRFCRSLIGIAIRLRHEGHQSPRLGLVTSSQTLTLLGVSPQEALVVAQREEVDLAAK